MTANNDFLERVSLSGSASDKIPIILVEQNENEPQMVELSPATASSDNIIGDVKNSQMQTIDEKVVEMEEEIKEPDLFIQSRVRTTSDFGEENNNQKVSCFSAFYSFPRMRSFCRFLFVFVSFVLMLMDILAAIVIAYHMWSQMKSHASGGVINGYATFHLCLLLGMIFVPFLILWTSGLRLIEQIFIEERYESLAIQSSIFRYLILYPSILLYIITPIGILFLIIYDIISGLYLVLKTFFFHFLFGIEFKENDHWIFQTQFLHRPSLNRFRKVTQMMSFSIPMMIFYVYIWYFDTHVSSYSLGSFQLNTSNNNLSTLDLNLDWRILMAGALISLSNTIWSFIWMVTNCRKLRISMLEFILLSTRMYGGFVPKLKDVGNGKTNKHLNYIRFNFDAYSFGIFSSKVEKRLCNVNKVILSSNSLLGLSKQICYQFGAILKDNSIKLEIWKSYSPAIAWQNLFIDKKHHQKRSTQSKLLLSELKQMIRISFMFEGIPMDVFSKVEEQLQLKYNTHGRYYYYSDFENDFYQGMYAPLLEILPPQLITDDDLQSVGNVRLLNLVLGTGCINELDPITHCSALYKAIVKLDFQLINRLCDRGARTVAEDWQKLGNYLIQLVKNCNATEITFEENVDIDVNKFTVESTLENTDDTTVKIFSQFINLARRRTEIEIDLNFHDSEGRTALMYAAMNGNFHICSYVLIIV